MTSKEDKHKDLNLSEEGLTEVLDFTITLGVMLLAVGMIGVAGYPMLENMQERGHLENIEQSFSVLKPNMNKVVYGKAPSQSVELKMHGGMVSVTGTSYMNVSVQTWNESTSSIEVLSVERQLRMVENKFEDTSIGYENTGAWAKYPQGSSIAISKPDFAYSENTFLIPMVTIAGSKGISGSGLIRVISDGGQLSVARLENVSHVNITMASDYYDGWEKFLNESMEMQIVDVDTANNTFVASRDYNPNIDVVITISPMSVTVE
ncbi:hypothetical protein V7O62_08030 [Methanolobus sp. ZRKC2]|uniref:DUF7289 family protein n=1 Tax=Methanolobus sp. ZRKC2 TaxID=3125783 RepID=UPI00325316B3